MCNMLKRQPIQLFVSLNFWLRSVPQIPVSRFPVTCDDQGRRVRAYLPNSGSAVRT